MASTMLSRANAPHVLRPSTTQGPCQGLVKPIRVAALCQHQRMSRPVVVVSAAAMDVEELPDEEAVAQNNQRREKKRSKRFKAMQQKIGVTRTTELEPMEAIRLAKASASVRFTESIEAHARMGLDPKYTDQQLRATVSLPNGTGKQMRVAVLSQGANLEAAKGAGAEVFGSDDLVDKITSGWLEFDKLIATPDMMPKVARLGRVLGPRGLMPNPKAGTVTTDVSAAVKEFKGGKVEYRLDKSGSVHVLCGRADFSDEKLLENLKAIQESIDANKPPGSKGQYWKSMHVCCTMGPSLRVNVPALAALKIKQQ
ncbi:ribosomal protein L1 [Dunaliella salina]|uniref:Ribosomal protein n=1 Tax=Dunaliella salina TaxID=3046 RepID=A0ABQ7GDA6_DUNSA|nr:ribosomal protein L1 [Dunaliella salina]|eukprot:KAF5832589.1 ribosomal protein L1 [Dunaliella salina]